MNNPSAAQIPLLILDGMRNENDGMAIVRIEQITNYPSVAALRELLEVLDKEGRTKPVNVAARGAAARIVENARGTAKTDMVARVLSASEKTSDGIFFLLSRNAHALPLEVKKSALRSGNIGMETKAELIRNSHAEDAYELLEILRISDASDKFEVIWNVAGSATKDEALRIEAMKELASFGNEGAIEFFESALGSDSPQLRSQAIFGLISLWSEDSENTVERILCAQLARERNQGLKLSIVQWIGENGRHTISRDELLRIVATEEDPRLVSTAEKALNGLRARLIAKPARFQSGPGVFATPTAPPFDGRATIDAEPPKEGRGGQPALAAEGSRKSDVRELAIRLRSQKGAEREDAADALAFIALASKDRKELKIIESMLFGCGSEFGDHLREIRARLEKMPLSGNGGEVVSRPSKRPTPPAPPPVFENGKLVRRK